MIPGIIKPLEGEPSTDKIEFRRKKAYVRNRIIKN